MANAYQLEDMPTLPMLYKMKWVKLDVASAKTANLSFNKKISIIRHDITQLKVDAIVNAANESLLGGGGVDGAIHRAAGPRLLTECEALDGCATGYAKVTNAHRLPCKRVIHAVGPVYFREKASGRHEMLLRGCYRRALEICEEERLGSVAFAALSTGVYGYPSNEAAETAISEVRAFFDEGAARSLQRVIFCNFLEKDETAYQKIIGKYFPDCREDQADLGVASASTGALGASKSKDQTSNTSIREDLTDDDWVEIDKPSSLHMVTLEDTEDEDFGR